jgi:hypothetical protein
MHRPLPQNIIFLLVSLTFVVRLLVQRFSETPLVCARFRHPLLSAWYYPQRTQSDIYTWNILRRKQNTRNRLEITICVNWNNPRRYSTSPTETGHILEDTKSNYIVFKKGVPIFKTTCFNSTSPHVSARFGLKPSTTFQDFIRSCTYKNEITMLLILFVTHNSFLNIFIKTRTMQYNQTLSNC